MSKEEADNLSPEELVIRFNNGETISEDVTVMLSSSEKSQSETLSCSRGLVKDELPISPVTLEFNNQSATQSGAPHCPNLINTNQLATVEVEKPVELQPPPSHTIDNRAWVGIAQGANNQNKHSRDTQAALDNGTNTDFDGLDIANPVELLLLLDDNILSGETILHDWQIQFMMDFANGSHTKESPFRAAVQACNGSGKDKYIIAACAVWLCMRYQEVECPITSSSGAQLDNQTGAHIDRLCNRSNAVFGPLWKVNYRYYEFQHKGKLGEPTPSKLKLFATDEPGKAEGYHPTDKGKKMAIFTSETKSIPEDITGALTRCTGYTHRVDASSPGAAAGYFYETCSAGVPREEIEDIKELSSVQTLLYKVTAYQCSHITPGEIESFAASLPGGKNSQVFKSGMLAEFGTTSQMVVIPSSMVWRSIENLPKKKKPFEIKWIPATYNEAGLDLSDGGAETVLAIRNGNKLIGMENFRLEDTEDTIDYLQELFKKWKLTHKDALIRGDYCGLGGPMLRSLKRKKWSNVRFVDSRNSASEPKTYANRGTELFFNVRKLLSGNELILFYDKLLIEQLCTRYYKLRDGAIHALLSKVEQKAKGFPSPDRADAFNLCFWNYKSTHVDEVDESPLEDEQIDVKSKEPEQAHAFDLNEWSTRQNKPFQPERVQRSDMEDLQEELANYNKQRLILSNK